MSNLINFSYFVHRYRTRKQLKSTKSRFNRDLENLNNPFANGVCDRPQDYLYERPSKTDIENIFLYAANNDNQWITINLHWNPIADENCGLIKVNFKLFGFNGDETIYEYKRSERIYNLNDYNDYSIGGFRLEIFSPIKRIKIRLNDFCTFKSTINDDNQQSIDYKFVRCIGIILPVQQIFDNLQQFDSKFISSQLTSQSQSFPLTDLTDIGSHIKLLVSIDQQSTVETNLWGLRSKLRFNQHDNYKNCQMIKFSGYAIKKGYNFSITLIKSNDRWFINGFSNWGITLVFPIVIATNSQQLIDGDEKINLILGNKYRLFNVIGNQIINSQSFYSITIDGCPGIGHYIRLPFTGNESDFDCKIVDCGPLIGAIPSFPSSPADPIVVNLDQPLAINSKLTGGKGSSLAKLTSILIGNQQLGKVPSGIVVTTKAYQLMSQSIGIQSYIDQLNQTLSDGKQDESKLQIDCDSIVNSIGSNDLPETIKQSILSSLNQLFDDNWINNKKLAIRSSAFGEDSTELSCAGQMETFLGISTLEEVYQCVMKCWASQFRFIAINYKLLNGLELNLPMAVVIQEMIDCDQAGVLFTCDPITGNQLTALITANYGLGESIVSSKSDPDTIRVKLEMSSNGLTINTIENIEIGAKEQIIKLNPSGDGTITIDSQLSESICCLNENQIINLTSTCLKFASYFNGPVDIEWGLRSDEIYLFQCRPVTSSSSSELTDWELSHEIDSAHVSSNEYHTRANLGEVYPGTTSYICHDYQMPSSSLPYVKKFFSNMKEFCFIPYVARGLVFNQHHCFFSLKDGVMFSYDTPPEKENIISTSMEYALLGQKIDDYDMKADSYERISQLIGESKLTKLKSTLDLVFMGPRRLRKIKLNQFQSKVDQNSTSYQMLNEILFNSDYIWDIFVAHLSVTIGSSIMNLLAISILSASDKNSPTVLTDFAKLLASCEQVVSAQIPVILKKLASKVNDENEINLITNLTDEQIEDYLKNGTSELAINYRQFITDYGHRGWKEFDWAGKVWRKDSSLIINPLRSLISQQLNSDERKPDKVTISDDQIIDSLETPLSKSSRFALKRFVLPWCRKYVSLREEGKNKLVWKIDQMRKLFDQMAAKLAYHEHRLPDPNLAYYLTPDELLQLTQSSNPGLVLLAKRRQKVLQKSDSFEFPIISIGPKMLPNNLPSEDDDDDQHWTDGQEITGTPVSQGKIKSNVIVARNLQDATQIKSGDILITYSTDIGWSPYFPIIGGLITEIGGLISHGAVIAREFGLPCVVNVKNACKIFKSGDLVSMDANKGVIMKLT